MGSVGERIVLQGISKAFGLLEFFIKNPDEWFTIRAVASKNRMDIDRVYNHTKVLEDNGFIHRERRPGFGKPMWVKLKRSKVTDLVEALYKELN